MRTTAPKAPWSPPGPSKALAKILGLSLCFSHKFANNSNQRLGHNDNVRCFMDVHVSTSVSSFWEIGNKFFGPTTSNLTETQWLRSGLTFWWSLGGIQFLVISGGVGQQFAPALVAIAA